MAQGQDAFADGELVAAGSGGQRRRVGGEAAAARTGHGASPGMAAGQVTPGHGGGQPGRATGGSGPGPVSGPGGAGAERAHSLETGTVADVLGGYLHGQATGFLRSLRLHGESAGSAETAAQTAEAVRQLRCAARRLNGALHTYRPLVDTAWADQLRAELSWLSGTLAREYAYAARLDRLLGALHRLASDGGAAGGGEPPEGGAGGGTGTGGGGSSGGSGGGPGALPMGAARAGALLERQLRLARTRAHSAALQALGSSRFHAVADAVAVLASEAPLTSDEAAGQAAPVLVPLAEQAQRRLLEAVDALPLARAEAPYNAEALARSLAAEAQQDAAWHQVRLLLRLHRYAEEVLLWGSGSGDGAGEDAPAPGSDPRLAPASAALDRHRDAAEAAAAAAAAARTPRIAPATAYALGVLHADQRHDVEAARFAFGRLWNAKPPGSEKG
ncbi:CHAD domain-containing protein [Streptomyces daliensis]